MGRNAKLHKRIKKKTTASSASHPSPGSLSAANTPNAPVVSSHVQAARKRADLKSKSKSKSKPPSSKLTGERVLGDADYVTLLMGGRKKAAKEALKLPKD
ncbi:uncharacterized protein F5147DRAFT_684586 [Suillus discolor]|uniref:Uncharacterized protein n=1 Tax=Suillus discolor TaxID=1912936 RepID=A0A9P7FAG5_9AGAM|nr:uncharacterized protein F5147DRAFT_684586 [Suillus discolor]KAG2112305.1 hypothetical protein F5147DRAFT_684586 [Suillus discolor]